MDGETVVIVPTEDPAAVTLELEVLETPDLGALTALIGALEELMRANALPLFLGQPIEFELPGFSAGDLGAGEQQFLLDDPEVALEGERFDHLTVRADLRVE